MSELTNAKSMLPGSRSNNQKPYVSVSLNRDKKTNNQKIISRNKYPVLFWIGVSILSQNKNFI